MKKLFIMIAVLATIATENSFAQHERYSKVHTSPSRAGYTTESYTILQLDKIVNLSRKQEVKIMNIERQYDRLVVNRRGPVSRSSIERLEAQKQKEIISVLSATQRQRLLAFEESSRYSTQRRYSYGR